MSLPTPVTPPTRIAHGGKRNWLWTIVCAHLGLWLVMAVLVVNTSPRFHEGPDFWFVVRAIAYAQASLLGFWAAVRVSHVAVALPRVLGLLGILTLVCMAYWHWLELEGVFVEMFSVMIIFAPFLATMLCWVVFVFKGWRLVRRDEPRPAPGGAHVQFSLTHMILWTVGIAVFFALAQALWPAEAGPSAHRGRLTMFMIPWLLITVVATSLLSWLCLTGTGRVAGWLRSIALVVGLLVFLLAALATDYVRTLLPLSGTQVLLVLVTLLALRGAGYRLRRSTAAG